MRRQAIPGAREGLLCEIDAPHGSGRRAGKTGVDQISDRSAPQVIENARRPAIGLDDADALVAASRETTRDFAARSIIAPVKITDANHHDGEHRHSATIEVEAQKVRGAGNTGVIVANGLLTAVLQLLIGKIEKTADEVDQILFDARLVL